MSLLDHTRLLALGCFLPCALLGCSVAPSGEDAVTADQAIASPSATGLCSDPLPSDDGQLLLLDVCPTTTGPGRIVIRRLHALTMMEVATYPSTSRVLSAHGNGEGYAVVVAKDTGSFDVLAGKWNAMGPAFRLDVGTIAGAAADAPKALHVTRDGKWLMGVSGATSVAFVTEIAPGALPVTEDLRSGAKNHRFLESGGRALLVSSRSEQTPLGRTLNLTGTATIGAPVDLTVRDHAIMDETYDGHGLFVERREHNGQLDRVDLATGAVTVVAVGDRVDVPPLMPAYGAGYVWYTNQDRQYDALADAWVSTEALYRVRADGSSAPETYRSVTENVIRFVEASGDVVVFTEGDALMADSLSAPGSARVLVGGLGWASSPVKAARRVADRIVVDYYSKAKTYESVVVGADGALAAQVPGHVLDRGPDTFSGDGTVYYNWFDPTKPVTCDVAGTDLRVCDGAYGLGWRLIAIPKSNAVIAVQTVRPGEERTPREMKIISP